ncbi:LTA synthase family protein [[Clostridium] polysaccharolyticum]|uniref:Phosphoglycerol transferase MdoB n=1 Tax=[Clostridium] polysaccharolyticum TaxID=29364 RepID=A0A1I0B492_9FIRM|nr:alkaline phosphatase family protein [[Clostridium] polysaccharolyticum]SET01539.1 Phosphoglycerol transferase MdoB [[Clostridium] polysaccharolyticum]
MKQNINFKKIFRNDIFQYAILSFVINIILEMMNRRSVFKSFQFLFHSPIVFMYNTIIVFITLSLGLLVKRRIFATTVIFLIWMILGVTNWIILGFRSTPFSAIDTIMIKNALELFNLYFTPIEVILLVIGFVLAVFALVMLWRKAPVLEKRKNFVQYICMIVIVCAAELLFTRININMKLLSSNFENLSYAYKNYGFVYCFTNSLVDVGISKPSNYSQKTVNEITEPMITGKLETPAAKRPNKQTAPNVIFIQLESFFDVNYVNDVTFSENPIPYFTNLKKHYTSGFLNVPSVGAGTANTEFEVLTGMSTSFFGAGEYPFKTILTKKTCESMAYLFDSQGYQSHAIHNNDGTFYSRNQVYANLGFDSFTPIEYMYDVEKNPRGWAKDKGLPDEIFKCIDSTKESDFVFTVSVQGHGRYPSEQIDPSQTITISGNDYKKISFEYYVNQIHEMDQMIGNLVDQLQESDEPTVLVLYGDHLPTLGLSESRLKNASMYQTEYVIWDNIGLKQQDEDLYSYQLSTKVFQALKQPLGIMQEYHVNYSKEDSEKYQKDMELLEYDLLYGNQYTYSNGLTAYEPAKMQMGIDKISLASIKKDTLAEKTYIITGKNLNEYSTIYVNNKQIATEFIDSHHLKITDIALENGDRVTSAQVGDDHMALGFSNELLIQP